RGMPVTIKSPGEDDITPEQKQYITDYFNLLEDAVFSANFRDSTEGYRKYLDLSSFIKHFIVGEFTGNTDTYWSTYMSKNRNSDQFVVAPSWDFDLAFNNDARIYPVCNRNSWVYTRGGSSAPNMNNFVTRILSDPYADSMLKEMWAEKTASGDFDPESLVHFVDSMAQVLDASQRLNFIRWPILDTRVHENAFALGSYEAEVGVLREYIPERVAWITDYLDYQDVEIRDTTIHIASAEDLINFAKYVNHGGVGSKGILTADIDMEGKTGYQPIGKEGMAYVGEFDGRGHVISNLHIKGGNYTGLFGVVSGGAYIHDFTLDSSCSIEGVAFVGVVGGSNDTGPVTIDKVGNEADVTGAAQNVSGIFGCNMNSSATIYLSNCYNTGRITGGNESATISGWLGNNAVVDNCYNIGEVSGTEGSKTFARGGFSHMNCYETGGRQVPSINASQIAGGELCYLLNDGRETWRQNLGSDAHPVLRRTHSVVYYDAGNGSYYNNPDDNPDDVPFIEATMAHYGIYDLKGRLVRKSAKGTAGLQKGIYLINGRKVVVR
ncbi:MAG: CotH kinase family protein, partial [Bacteroidaceae bacterium]|nr:CotH kinase family protein [Bacteroidaceae bacterium]